jgi:hypothetical protein
VFAAPHPNHEGFTQQYFWLPADETTQIALIPRFFVFAWNGPDGGRKQEMRKPHAWLAYSELLLPERSHHFAVQQTDSLQGQNRNRK